MATKNKAAGNALTKQDGSADKGYTSGYSDQIKQTMNSIISREPFNYNVNEDKLYSQYKDTYTQLGNTAMKDTMGNAALLTGGYQNSYAVSAGQQAYNDYMQKLSGIIPELEQRAYDRWLSEGDALYDRLNALQSADNTEYSRYRDSVSDSRDARDYARSVYESDRDYNYQKSQDALAQSNWQKQYDRNVLESDRDYNRGVYENDRDYNRGVYESDRDYNYQKSQDAVAQSNWQKQYDRSVYESDRDYNREVYENDRSYINSRLESAVQAEKDDADGFTPDMAYSFMDKYKDVIHSDDELVESMFRMFGDKDGFIDWLGSVKLAEDSTDTALDVLYTIHPELAPKDYLNELRKNQAKKMLSQSTQIAANSASAVNKARAQRLANENRTGAAKNG